MNDKKNGILYNKYVPERKEKNDERKIKYPSRKYRDEDPAFRASLHDIHRIGAHDLRFPIGRYLTHERKTNRSFRAGNHQQTLRLRLHRNNTCRLCRKKDV